MYQITDKTFLELLTDPTIELKPIYSIDENARIKIVELVIINKENINKSGLKGDTYVSR